MDKREKSGVLAREREYVKYYQLLRKAEKEGRLDGAFTCMLCGMRFATQEEANSCCRITVT